MKTLKDIKNIKTGENITLGDVIAIRENIDHELLELLHMAEIFELSGDVFKAYRDAEKATSDAVLKVHKLAEAVEKHEKQAQL